MNRLLAIRLPFWLEALLSVGLIAVMALTIGGCGGIAPGFSENHDLTITYNGASNPTPLKRFSGGSTAQLLPVAISALANQQLGSHVATYIVRPNVTPGNWRVFASDVNTPQIRIEDQTTPAAVQNVSMTNGGDKVVIGPAGDFVYVLHAATAVIDVINSVTYVPDLAITLGTGPAVTDMDFDATGKLVVLRGGSTVAIVNTATRLITTQQTVDASGALAKIASSPDGSMIAVSRPGTSEVLLLDGVTLSTVATVATAASVSEIVFNNTGTRLYGLSPSSIIEIDPEAAPPAVSLTSSAITSTPAPVLSSLRLSLLGGFLYCLNSSDQSMRIFKTSDLTQTQSVPTAAGAVDIAVRHSYTLTALPQNANGGGFVEALVNTNPANAGLEIDVDGVSYTNSHSYSAAGATLHTHATTSPQTVGGAQYTFGNWTPGGTALSQSVALPGSGSATYTAAFKLSGYLVTIVVGKGCSATTNPPSANGQVIVAPNGSLSITPSPLSSATTVGAVTWTNSTGTGSIAAPYNYTVTSPTTINVGCNPATTVMLTVATSPVGLQGKIGVGGSFATTPVSQSVPVNVLQSIAVPDPQFSSVSGTGYSFTGWSNGTNTTISSTQLTSDTTVTASFKAACYTVTTNVLPAGSGAVNISTPSVAGFPVNCYAPGTVVTLTGTPVLGYVLQSWTGATSSAGGTTATVNGPLTVTANFAVPPCTGIAPPAGLISWYPLDEAQSPALNYATNGPKSIATWTGNPTPVTGKVGNALALQTDSWLTAASAAEGDVSAGDFSFDAWVKASPSGYGAIVQKMGYGSDFQIRGYEFYLDSGKLNLLISDDSSQTQVCGTNPATSSCTVWSTPMVPNGQWHFVAVTVVRNSTSGGKFYIDGTLAGTFDPTVRTQSITNPGQLMIGNGGPVSLDEVEIFSRALTAAEIQALYGAGSGGKCKPILPTSVLTVQTNPTGLQGTIGTSATTAAPVTQVVSTTQTQTVSVTNPQFNSATGTGYSFVNWSTGATTASTTVQPTAGSTTVVANFKIACHLLTVNVFPANIASIGFGTSAPAVAGFPANCYPPGTTVTLTAKTALGNLIPTWVGATPNKDGSATLTMGRPITAAAIFLPQVCTPPPAGLIAWYPFDEVKSPSLDYATGGAQLNATWTDGSIGISTAIPGPVSVPGVVGNALLFREFQWAIANGTVAGTVGTADFTIDAWVQFSNDGGRRGFLERVGYALFLDDGYLGFSMTDNTALPHPCSSNPATSACTEWISPAMIADNQWHFVTVAVVRNSPVGGKIYVDGSPVLTFDPTIRPLSLSSHPSQLLFGGAEGTTKLDEVEIFNRSLSEAEVEGLYAAGSLGKCKPPAPAVTLTVQTSPAGLQGRIGTSGSYAAGPVSQSVAANSVQTISVTDPQFDSASGIGYSFVNWDTGATTATTTVSPNASMTATANFKVACYTLTANILPKSAGSIVYRPLTGVPGFPSNCYAPGTAVTLSATSVAGPLHPIWAGAPSTGDTATVTMGSSIAVTAILPQSACLAPPTGLTTWYPLDEAKPPYQNYATSGPQSDATVLYGAVSTAGMVGNAVNFGPGQWAQALNTAEGDIATGNFSIDAWVRASTATSPLELQTIVEKREFPATGGIRGYSLYLRGGYLTMQLGDNSTPVAGCSVSRAFTACTDWISTASVADGNWHFVAATISRGSTTGGKLYVDGTLVLTFDPTIRNGSLANGSPLLIGSGKFSYDLLGAVDELEIFNRELSQTELQAIYAAGSIGKCKPSIKPVTLTVQTSPIALQARIGGSGAYAAAPVSQLVTPNQPQTIGVSDPQFDAPSGTGYSFSSWSTGGSTASTTVTPPGNLTATATFKAACYLLTINVLPAGAGTVVATPKTGVPGFPGACYAPGTVVTLNASGSGAVAGVVQSWTGAAGTGNTATVTINGPTTVTATFK